MNIREELNKLDLKAIDNDEKFYDLVGLYEGISLDITQEDKKALHDLVNKGDGAAIDTYIAGVRNRKNNSNVNALIGEEAEDTLIYNPDGDFIDDIDAFGAVEDLNENRTTLKPVKCHAIVSNKPYWSPYDTKEHEFASFDTRYRYDSRKACSDAIADKDKGLGYYDDRGEEAENKKNKHKHEGDLKSSVDEELILRESNDDDTLIKEIKDDLNNQTEELLDKYPGASEEEQISLVADNIVVREDRAKLYVDEYNKNQKEHARSQNKNGYSYKDHFILNSTKNGMWYVKDSNNDVLGSFSTDVDAEDFVDSLNENFNEGLNEDVNDTTVVVPEFLQPFYGWSDEDVDIYNATNWADRDYEDLDVGQPFMGSIIVKGADVEPPEEVEFHKFIRCNPSLSPCYKPVNLPTAFTDNTDDYMYCSGNTHDGINVFDTYGGLKWFKNHYDKFCNADSMTEDLEPSNPYYDRASLQNDIINYLVYPDIEDTTWPYVSLSGVKDKDSYTRFYNRFSDIYGAKGIHSQGLNNAPSDILSAARKYDSILDLPPIENHVTSSRNAEFNRAIPYSVMKYIPQYCTDTYLSGDYVDGENLKNSLALSLMNMGMIPFDGIAESLNEECLTESPEFMQRQLIKRPVSSSGKVFDEMKPLLKLYDLEQNGANGIARGDLWAASGIPNPHNPHTHSSWITDYKTHGLVEMNNGLIYSTQYLRDIIEGKEPWPGTNKTYDYTPYLNKVWNQREEQGQNPNKSVNIRDVEENGVFVLTDEILDSMRKELGIIK